MAENSWSEAQLRKYTFPTEPLPRIAFNDKETDKLISKGLPVVITGSNLVGSAQKWNLHYLEENMGDGDFTVYESDSHIFKYWDEKKAEKHKGFKGPIKRAERKFENFVDIVKSKKIQQGKKRYYLQQALNDSVGPKIVEDYKNFNHTWSTVQQLRNKWGPLTSNLLLIGMEGNVTPCHYDEQENLFCQVHGHKRVILFPPSQFENLYTYPVHHPHDRQCQVNFDKPDLEKFPNFKHAKGMEAVLGPGDVLYLPMYWFHHFESLLDGGMTTSITFWYKGAPAEKIDYPLKPQQKIAMMRNIEKMITEALNNHDEVGPFFRTLVSGRYTDDVL